MNGFVHAVLVVLGISSSMLLGQQVWKVDCTGTPGSHFIDLPPAVAAAAPGDTILVYNGMPGACVPYPYTAPTITKPLRIVGFNVAWSPGSNTPSYVAIRGPLSISGIGAGEKLCLCNVYLEHLGPPALGPLSPVDIMDCAGDVVLEDVFYDGGGWGGQRVSIQRCANVVLRGCYFDMAGAPVSITDSHVLITTTLIHEGNFALVPPLPASTTTEALQLVNSTVTLVDSVVRGAFETPPQPARRGARLTNSTLRVGPATLLEGGQIAGGGFGGAYSVLGTQPSVVEVDPRAVIRSVPFPPPTVVSLHSTYHDWIVADEDYHVAIAGPIGGFALLALGALTSPTPTPFGTLHLDPTTMQAVSLAYLPPPAGSVQWTFHCPSLVQNGFPFVFQSLTIASDGTLGVTVPSPLTVGWEHGRIP